jgi:hypothetical protein
MGILNQKDKDIILYGANDKLFGIDKAKFDQDLQMSEHYNRGSDKNRTKEVVNLKEMADTIKAKLSKKELFFLNYFMESKTTHIRRA